MKQKVNYVIDVYSMTLPVAFYSINSCESNITYRRLECIIKKNLTTQPNVLDTQKNHWRSSQYAVTHVLNKNSNIQGRSPKVVKVIFHTKRNCS